MAPPYSAPVILSCISIINNYSGIGAGFGVLLLTVIVKCGVITAQCVQNRGIRLKYVTKQSELPEYPIIYILIRKTKIG